MKYYVLLLGFLFTHQVLGVECIVVSGAKNDDNGAFKNRKLLNPQTSMLGSQKCLVVDGLQKLKNLVATNVIKGPNLMVVFGAHGSKDDNGNVKFHFNADAPTADEVYSYLRKLSARYQVGAVLHACQSGEVMHKLVMEENDPLAGKLCLLTSSSRGRSSFSNPDDLISVLELVKEPNSGTNLEDIFLKTKTGMISSAAWEETGVATYYRTKDLNESVMKGFKALQSMDQIVRSPGVCENEGETNSALCVASGISDKLYKDLMHFMDPYVPNKEKRSVLDTYPIIAQMYSGNGRVCLKGLTDFYSARIQDLNTWSDLESALSEIKKNIKLYAVCEAFKKETPDENIKRTLYSGDMHDGLVAHQESLARLKRVYTKTNWAEFNLNEFARDAAGDKKVCNPLDKKETIQSLFGDGFFKEDYYMGLNGGDENIPSEISPYRNINTQHMMKAFQNASVDMPNMSHSIDQKRREACRKMKL